MDKKDLRIIYLGTPDFAVAPLRRLVDQGYNVVAVVTMPDKPSGRGHKLQPSPVKAFAVEHGLPVLQPERLKDEAFLEELRSLRADLQIVVAFRMLPQIVWSMPPMGTFNLHASLLPKYRGAAPINWAIINGEVTTGVTTFLLTHEIDTGAILRQASVAIDPNETAGTLHDKLMTLGAEEVVHTVDALLAGQITAAPQSEYIAQGIEPCPAPKIFKEDCKLDYTMPVAVLARRIRGFAPYPATWFDATVNQTPMAVKIFAADPVEEQHELPVGTIEVQGKEIRIAATDGFLCLRSFQIPGKKTTTPAEFLNGNTLQSR